MGTRNLTCVFSGGDFKIAQYCQWDGYPTGQGYYIVQFLKSVNMDRFRQRVQETVFVDDGSWTQRLREYGLDGSMDSTQEIIFKGHFPQLHRDTGAKILTLLMQSDGQFEVQSSLGFAFDGLFCEYAYVIDLDKNELAIYLGYGRGSGLGHFEAYVDKFKAHGKYGPCKLWKTIPFEEVLKMDMQSLKDLEAQHPE